MTQQPTPRGPFCQSCSMPMSEQSLFGTEAGGAHSEEYCTYCYREGAFTSDVTMEEMVEISAKGMSEAMGTPEAEAKAMLQGILPGLKRWRTAA